MVRVKKEIKQKLKDNNKFFLRETIFFRVDNNFVVHKEKIMNT